MPRTRARARKMTNGHGMSVPGHLPEAELGEARREVAHAARSEDDQGEAAEERERAERHDERRQPAARDEQAVQQAAQDADDEHDGDRDLHRDAGRPQEAEDGAGQPGHRLDRQVDLAGDDDQRHRQGHDRDLHQGRDEVAEVARRQEERARARCRARSARAARRAAASPSARAARVHDRRSVAGVVAALIGCGSARRRAGGAAG